jgi:dipeptidyl aminopeptidase/acylaminoacyl peptidase
MILEPVVLTKPRDDHRRLAMALLASFAALAMASVSAAAERPVHRFLEVVLSPDGSLVASVEGDSPLAGGAPTIRDLVIRGADGSARTPIALPCGRVAECTPSSLTWSPDGKRLVFALRTPGGHARSIYSLDIANGAVSRLLAFNGTLVDLRFGPDGRLGMLATAGADKEVGATQAGAPVTGDLGGPTPEQRIAVLDGDHLDFVSPPDLYVYEYNALPGGGFIGTAAPGDGDDNWWVAKLYAFAAGAAPKLLFAPPDARHQITYPTVSSDGKTIAFISGIMSDFGSTGGDIYTLPVSGGDAVDLTPGMPATATSIGFGCDGALLARLLAGDQAQIVSVKRGEAPKVLWSGAELIEGDQAGLSLACPATMTATVHESFTAPPEIELGAIGAWRDLTHANAGLSAPLKAQSLTWTNDGLRVQGWLLTPLNAGPGKLPMITSVHGGPAAANEPRFVGPGLTRALLTHGYAVFLPNPRGSFGQGEAFTAANVRDLGHGDLRDILAGIDAAERAAPIDEARLGITGGSYGGFMTMWAVTQTHRFKAGVAAAGLSDWLSYYGENGIDQWMIPYFGKSVYDDPEVYARSSPINFIKNVTTPTFAYVGAQDIECPAPQTQEFWHALHDLGVPTAIAIYPGEGHGLRDPDHIADSEKRVLDWFGRYLKP